jgi:hypothetical protein
MCAPRMHHVLACPLTRALSCVVTSIPIISLYRVILGKLRRCMWRVVVQVCIDNYSIYPQKSECSTFLEN